MQKINNDIYEVLGENWYHANDNPVALLRAESRLRNPWVVQKINEFLGRDLEKAQTQVLDVGCGAGFLSNYLTRQGYLVHGLDLSEESLKIAEKYDETGKVHFHYGNAAHLPFKDNCFDVVTAMDFLEHVEHPQQIIAEVSRVLRPGGLFLFHTFNRNWLSWLIIIKAVEFFVKNTPKHLHILRLFIKPEEMKTYCNEAHLDVRGFIGYRPQLLKKGVLVSFLKGVVPADFSFCFTSSLKTSYSGYAVKFTEAEVIASRKI